MLLTAAFPKHRSTYYIFKIHVDVLDTETDKNCLDTCIGQPNDKVQSSSESDHFRSQIFKPPLPQQHIISVAFDHESG